MAGGGAGDDRGGSTASPATLRARGATGVRFDPSGSARFDGWFVSALAAPLAPAEFVAVDTETNGYGGDLCEMTEVGAVLVGGGELHETYDSLVRVERPLSRGIQRFTGITQGMVDGAPPPDGGAPRAGRPARGARDGRAQRALRRRRAAPGVRARRARLAEAAGDLHRRAGAPVRAAGAQARAGVAGRLARHRGRRGAPRAARRAHVRARVLRAVPEAVRERDHGRRRARPAPLAPARAQDRAGRGDPARPAPGPLDAARRPRRVRLPRRAREAAVRGEVGVAPLARARALLRARRLDRARGDRGLPAHELGAGRARAREPADQAVEAGRATGR